MSDDYWNFWGEADEAIKAKAADEEESPFVDTSIWRERRERERATKKARRRCLWSFVMMILLFTLAFFLFLNWDALKAGESVYIPGQTPAPAAGYARQESEETTIHYIIPDWDELIVQAVLDGNERLGADCAEIGDLGYTYDDLYLLAKILREEDGADGDGHEWPDMPIIALANVVLNRVASPLFPDTIREVLYQEGPGDVVQYAPVHTDAWETTEPTERYVRLAQRALEGERVIGEDVIYQALFAQGKVIMTYYDEYMGSTTYFCKG